MRSCTARARRIAFATGTLRGTSRRHSASLTGPRARRSMAGPVPGLTSHPARPARGSRHSSVEASRQPRIVRYRRDVTEHADLRIIGGTVVDGTGAPGRPGTVEVVDGRIRLIEAGEADPETPAARTIDATGKVVAPGFIDLHSHGGLMILADGRDTSRRSARGSRPSSSGWTATASPRSRGARISRRSSSSIRGSTAAPPSTTTGARSTTSSLASTARSA